MQTMVELTVVFANPQLDNYVRLTGPFDGNIGDFYGDEVLNALQELHDLAHKDIPDVKDEQCFYRFFSRE